MLERTPDVELSVIVPVGSRQADAVELYREYKAGLDSLGQHYEIIFVLDGPRAEFAAGLQSLLDGGDQFTVVSLSRAFGEATAIMTGFEYASGEAIVTLPAYFQIEATEVATLLGGLESADLVVGRRWPRSGGAFERARRAAFHRLLGWVTKLNFSDLGCGARAFDRRVLDEVQLYGDQHRFLAVLADRHGFRVREIDLRQSPKDRFEGIYQPRDYTRGLLDIFTVFFLVRFTKKPLRFFGMIGVSTFAVGALAVLAMIVERLLFGHGLTERPALLLASLLVVLGLQFFALGLLGELLIFTHARGLKDYQVERVIHFRSRGQEPGVQ
jgi:glycosyltransferase involved in cell wall biosynthesis